MRKNFVSEHRRVGTVLQVAVALSMFLILIGLGLFFAGGGDVTKLEALHVPEPSLIIKGLAAFEPAAFITAGILILLLTPFIRVVGAFVTFMTAERDLTYTVISLGVLAVLIAGLFVPGLR